jgi:hypothetical protein
MMPYYLARDGYPSMFELEGNVGAAAGTTNQLDRPIADPLLTNQLRCPVDRRALDPEPLHAECPKIGRPARPTGSPGRHRHRLAESGEESVLRDRRRR